MGRFPMSFLRIFAITGRIVSQFRHDHRTLGLVFVVPIVVMSLLGYVFRSQETSTVNLAVVNLDNPTAKLSEDLTRNAAVVAGARLSDDVISNLKKNDKLII